jgi:hypothetical protein
METTTPSERLRWLLRHFGLTPKRVNVQSGGRFGRWAVKSWLDKDVEPSAVTASAFVSWLSELNRDLARRGLPSLASRFLRVEWIWGPAGDSHGNKDSVSEPPAQWRAS